MIDENDGCTDDNGLALLFDNTGRKNITTNTLKLILDEHLKMNDDQ